jgi:pyridoxal/pyridoxine/pyridoxamine kinase
MDKQSVEKFQEIITKQCDEISALKEKAEAYDRLMSGGMKKPKEVANVLGLIVAQDQDKLWWVYVKEPVLAEEAGYWMSTEGRFSFLPIELDYSGDWKDSLTLPDEWEG